MSAGAKVLRHFRSDFFLFSRSHTHTIKYLPKFSPFPYTIFDFEKLEVYQKAKSFNHNVFHYISSHQLDRTTKDQLGRASFSIRLNFASGSSRSGKQDRRNFFVIARGSIFECVAIFDFLKNDTLILMEYE